MTKQTRTQVLRQRLGHDERRQQILAIARLQFSERSFAEVSNGDIANAAGVQRGLLHHYFGSKRDLFLEVVRELLADSVMPVESDPGGSIEVTMERNVARWLDFVEANSSSWFALLGAEGFGRDYELESLVAEARDATVQQIINVLGIAHPSDELRTVLRTFSGLVEMATREWLLRETLTKKQTVVLLTSALSALVREVAPAVEAVHHRS